MSLNTELLSRIQFGITIGFHVLFPTLNIGLAIFLSVIEGFWLKTKNPVYLQIAKFWTKIFALTFGMGVVSGIVMAYQFGTNFGRFIGDVGSILGPLFGYEVLSAFFLEAGFLGVMLFGWNRVGPKMHYVATLFVTVGTILSAFWILSANSWMQTPSGFEISGNKYVVDNWWDVIFNPSVVVRFTHMLLASLVTTCFVLAGVTAWYLLKHRHLKPSKKVFSFTLLAAIFLVPIQLFVGDSVGLEVHKNQPIKTAAMEANWHTMQGAPLILFAYPDVKQAKNLFTISIPYGASLINTHSLKGTLQGITSVSRKDWPIVAPVFYTFRIMVGIGVIFLIIVIWGLLLRIKKQLYASRSLLWSCVLASPLGFVATISGWLTAELGRQPWIVYNLIRTEDGTSLVPMAHVIISLILLVVVYGIIFSFYLYFLFKLIRKGPRDLEEPPMTAGYATQAIEGNSK